MSAISSIFTGTLVHTLSLGTLQILPSHLLAIDLQGYIVALVPGDSPDAQRILADNSHIVPVEIPPGSFLLPTFVDLHLHAPQFLYLGTGLHLPLMEWLDAYAYKAEERLDADSVLAERVYTRLAERLVEAGTGAVLAFGTIKVETK